MPVSYTSRTPLPEHLRLAVATTPRDVAEAMEPDKPARRQASNDLGPKPDLQWLRPAELEIDPRYQRDLSSRRSMEIVARILERFSWAKFQPPTVVAIGPNRWVVVDGQHRVEAAKQHPLVDFIPCYIIEAPELRQQADSFVAVNVDRVAMHPLHIYHAALVAAEPQACRIASICQRSGITIPRNAASNGDLKPGQTLAVATIRKALVHGDRVVTDALTILREAFSERGGQLRGSIIEAMVGFVAAHAGFDHARLIRTLAEHDIPTLDAAAKAYRGAFGGTKGRALTMALVKAYNRGLRAEQRLPEGEG